MRALLGALCWPVCVLLRSVLLRFLEDVFGMGSRLPTVPRTLEVLLRPPSAALRPRDPRQPRPSCCVAAGRPAVLVTGCVRVVLFLRLVLTEPLRSGFTLLTVSGEAVASLFRYSPILPFLPPLPGPRVTSPCPLALVLSFWPSSLCFPLFGFAAVLRLTGRFSARRVRLLVCAASAAA